MDKPKIQFPTNVPVTVVLGNQFWSGTGQYGPSFGWNMTENGVEKSCFVKPYLNDKIKDYPAGTQLTITKKEITGEGGRPRTEWQVISGATPSNGHAQTMRVVTDRGEYRTERIARAKEAITDAQEALESAEMDENVRALAISFLIDEQHKNISAPTTQEEPF